MEVHDKVSHNFEAKEEPPYIVWAEDEESGTFYADDVPFVQRIAGTITLVSVDEFDPLCDAIQQSLAKRRIEFRKTATIPIHEEKTVHHEWSFRLWLGRSNLST